VLNGRPGKTRLISRLSGAAMTALGVFLLLDHFLT
jgi:hypothetical protein